MGAVSRIAGQPVSELVASIAREGLSAGAGAAGAVAVALAAACAGKAAAVTLKHHPTNEILGDCQKTLQRIGELALEGADRDVAAFAAFIKQQSHGAASELTQELDLTLRLIQILAATLDQMTPQVDAGLVGDLIAARALNDAARKIQERNLAEARTQKAKIPPR